MYKVTGIRIRDSVLTLNSIMLTTNVRFITLSSNQEGHITVG